MMSVSIMHFKQVTDCTSMSRYQQVCIYTKFTKHMKVMQQKQLYYSGLTCSTDDTEPPATDERTDSFDTDNFTNCSAPGGRTAAQLNDGSDPVPSPRLRNAMTGTVRSFGSTCCRPVTPANASVFEIPNCD